MWHNLEKLLCCPQCRADLDLEVFKSSDHFVEEGILLCKQCKVKYPIVNSIPRMVPRSLFCNPEFEKKYGIKEEELVSTFGNNDVIEDIQIMTDRNFGHEWEYYSRFGWDDEACTIEHTRKWFFGKTLLTTKDVKDRLILDAGCGNGRYSRVAAELGGRVCALDLGKNVDAAKENFDKLGLKVMVIQGDLLNIPLKSGIFDSIFTIGVIQHTGDPKRAFASMVDVLKRDGLLAIRTYGKGNKMLEENDENIRSVTTQMNLEDLHRFSSILNELATFLEEKGLLKSVRKYINLWDDEHTLFDWYSAPVADKFTFQQYYEWFEKAGIELLRDNNQHIPEEERIFSTVSVLGRKK